MTMGGAVLCPVPVSETLTTGVVVSLLAIRSVSAFSPGLAGVKFTVKLVFDCGGTEKAPALTSEKPFVPSAKVGAETLRAIEPKLMIVSCRLEVCAARTLTAVAATGTVPKSSDVGTTLIRAEDPIPLSGTLIVDVQSFAQYNLMSRLGPALTEIFAADDSEFGRLFSNYLTKPPGSTNKPPAIPAVTSDTSATQPK